MSLNSPDESTVCPKCGEPMQPLPALNGDHSIPICLQCLEEPESGNMPAAPSLPSAQPSKDDSLNRFRKILAEEHKTKGSQLPNWMMDDLPEATRRLLSEYEPPSKPSLGPKLSDELARSLRDQGYVIHEDEKGVHLGGAPIGRGKPPGEFSPYDVVRMAADIEGGISPQDELVRCNKCNAPIPPGKEHCQWCDE